METLVSGWNIRVESSSLHVPIFIDHGRHDYVIPYILWDGVVDTLPNGGPGDDFTATRSADPTGHARFGFIRQMCVSPKPTTIPTRDAKLVDLLRNSCTYLIVQTVIAETRSSQPRAARFGQAKSVDNVNEEPVRFELS